MRIALVLFLLFTVGPIAETWLILQAGHAFGTSTAFFSLVLAGLLGAWLGKRAGGAVFGELMDGLKRGEPPADKIVEGVLALVGAVLLITPGYLSDVAGLLLLWQPTRRWIAPRAKRALWDGLKARGFVFMGDGAPGPATARKAETRRKFDHPVAD